MGGNLLETLQEEYDKAYKPIHARCEYFSNTASQIRQLLLTHFSNETTKAMLVEEAQTELEDGVQRCLVKEEVLIATAEQFNAASGRTLPSLVHALDEHIVTSGLPVIVLNNQYQLKLEKPYPAKVQDFMQQFVDSLTAYRISLGICDIYFAMIRYSYLDLTAHKECLCLAQQLQDLLPESGEKVDLQNRLRQAKANKKKINALLVNVYEGAQTFDEELPFKVQQLVEQFERGRLYLQDCYKKFPNNTKLAWLFFDGAWQALLKNIANNLYAAQCTYSSLYGSLTISPDFIAEINREIVQFRDAALERLPELKTELLMTAYQKTNQVIVSVKKIAAIKRISLDEAPPMLFATGEKSIWGLMAAYYQPLSEQPVASTWANPVVSSSTNDDLGNESPVL
ncbi:hypothetical protein [Legionella feeleii]|uniref:Coiled-coil protein n=1 Tax=Legionella feeleii TaxID=453 RepID=A0A0W0U7W6_9GAMM|nr:hypothetical protein [Legionella feeleii]KTD03909.1 coiled-coil protein [Legionella feeleii]SPX61494.1 coiled-coil protein [Legionella feeleii]